MKKIPLYALLALLIAIVSCKKDEGGGNTSPAVKFMSFTAGSTWDYKVTDSPSSASPTVRNYTLTSTSNDTVANGKTYTIFTSSGGANEYYNITGGNYFTFRALPASLLDSSIEVLYLKDDVAVGATWEQSIPITVATYPLTLKLNHKIAGKGLSRTVNGIAYTNVTDVQTTLTVTGIPPFISYTLTSDIHYYYAPKFGQIENKTKIDFVVNGIPGVDPVHFEQKTELQNATIL